MLSSYGGQMGNNLFYPSGINHGFMPIVVIAVSTSYYFQLMGGVPEGSVKEPEWFPIPPQELEKYLLSSEELKKLFQS